MKKKTNWVTKSISQSFIAQSVPWLLSDAVTGQITNLILRVASLAGKLLLMLFMGRYFDLSSIGAYGLVFGAVMLVGAFAGQSFNYVVMREIIDMPRIDALARVRDQVVWYLLNYALLGGLLVANDYLRIIDIPSKYFIFLLVLSVTEGLGSVFYYNMNSFGQQFLANISLFVRAAAWVPFVVVLGLYDPKYLHEDTVLLCWSVGSALSLTIPLVVWSRWGWRKVFAKRIDWPWIRNGVKKSSYIWLGTLSGVAGSYLDRYVVNHYINLELVGVLTFFYSFVNAFFPLIESGVIAFASPKMVGLHRRNEMQAFWLEVRRAGKQIAIAAGGLAVFLSLAVPSLSIMLDRHAFVRETQTLLLLLAATWFNVMSMGLTHILFAQHRDGPVWTGSLFYCLVMVVANFSFVPVYGFSGIGYSALVAALCLFIWRLCFVDWPMHFWRYGRS